MINLTRREQQVLFYIYEELSNVQIADELGITKSTVDKYRRNLLWKFDAKNIVGVIRRSHEQGILPMSDPSQFNDEQSI